MSNILKVNATENELKAYFEAVCRIIDEKQDEFPINLDEVWPLAYTEKGAAVRALKNGFIEGVDYKTIDTFAKREIGGTRITDYYITISCLEFLIARKKREVFEVYRQVFHAARKGQLGSRPMTHIQMLAAQAQAMVELEQRQIESERQQKVLESRIERIETQSKDNGFMAVMGFANLSHINIGEDLSRKIGKQCSAWCKRMGVTPEKIRHKKFGGVNTYPLQALKDIFKANFPDKTALFDTVS